MACNLFVRLCALLPIALASCTTTTYYEYCDEHLIAYHEAGHAIYSIVTGLNPSAIVVSRDGNYVHCPDQADAGNKYCGLVCYEGRYSSNPTGLWNSCSLSKAGRYGVSESLGFEEPSRCHSTDDEHAAKAASAITEARDRGEPWLPDWPTSWSEDDEPTADEITAECQRHARETLQANHDLLSKLGQALEDDPDGLMTEEEVLDAVCL